MRPTLPILAAFVFITLTLSSCAIFGGGDSGLKRASDYELQAPSDWEKLKSKGDTDKAFRLPSGNAVTVISSCKNRKRGSLKVLSRQLLIGTRNRQTLQEKPIEISDGSGLFTHVKANLDGKVVYLGLVVIKKKSCVFDFTLMSPKNLSNKELSEFLAFAQSLDYDGN